MPPVFYRFDGNDLERHLARWDAHPDYPRRAMAWNLRYDHRVVKPREAALTQLVNQNAALREPGIDPLQKSVVAYQKTSVQQADRPSFLDPDNTENFANSFHPMHSLGTIVDLTALARTVADANLAGHPAFAQFRLEDQADYQPDSPAKRIWNGFLEAKFWNRTEIEREDFLADLFYALRVFSRHPVWVTSWTKLSTLLAGDSPRCLESLGMPRVDAPRVLIALRYPVREAGMLVRPCQLDGGDYVYHYPSPPKREVRDGGVTMELRVPRESPDLIPEYIHAQILFKSEFWRAANRWTIRTSGPVPCDLWQARKQHQEALRSAHSSHEPPWMEEFKI